MKPEPSAARRVVSLSCSCALPLLIGCSSASFGSVTITAYGEEFIEDGIPAGSMDDGWTIDFSRFEVTLSEVTLGGVTLGESATVDLTEASGGNGQELGSVEVPAGEHTNTAFVIGRVELEGSAQKDDVTKTFSWVFAEPVAYQQCETTTEVDSNESATFQITVHADHLFYDSLVAEEPKLLFQPLADADVDADGDITRAELGETDIGAYDPGSSGGIDDLWAFLEAQTATLGHVDGEGHCHATAVE